jgi:hypothetical protein
MFFLIKLRKAIGKRSMSVSRVFAELPCSPHDNKDMLTRLEEAGSDARAKLG